MPVIINTKEDVEPKPKPKTISIKKGKMTATKELPDKPPETVQQEIGPEVVSEQPMANVGVSVGMTIPNVMGAYSNAKVGVDIHLPCLATETHIEAAYSQAKDWAYAKMSSMYDEILEETKFKGDDG